MYSVMWSEHCSYKSSKVHLRTFGELTPGDPDRQAAGRHRRERRRGRHRSGLRRHLQGRVAQPPVLRRAVPGRGHRGRRHRPRHPGHGRAPDRRDGSAPLRPAGRPRHGPGAARGRRRRRRLRQLPRSAQHRRRGGLRRAPTPATRWSTRSASACCGTRTCTWPRPPGAGNKVILYGAATGGDGIGGASVLASETFEAATTGRPPGKAAREAPGRAGRRPVHGEAADRVHPRAVRRQAGHRHPGLRRGRHLLRHLRAGRGRRRRHARRARRRAAARLHAEPRGDPDERVAGTDDGGRRAATTSTRSWPSAASGTCRPPWSARSPTATG